MSAKKDPTTKWAQDVVAGKIVSGHLMRLACERHLRDKVDGPKRGIHWRPEKAAHALGFFPAVLRVTAGAHEGEPFELPSYTTFVVGSLFGWNRSDGLLRFRNVWLEAGKGQIKALDVATPIATPSGWTTMGGLKTGDEVFDEHGRPCCVTKAHAIRDDSECYAVCFSDGSEIVADAGHLWSTSAGPSERASIRTTAEIAETLKSDHHIGTRRIVSCDWVPSVPVRCISVDSKSQMFLAGRSLIPTHNSPLMAALGIYMMGYCGIQRSECYAIAKDRKQANVLFQDAVKMCQAPIPDRDEETLESTGEVVIRGTGEISYMIEHPATRSKFIALAGDEKVNGPRPSLVAADEIHEWRSDGPIRTWTQSLVKIPGNALMILGTNTPAVDQPVGTDYSERYQQILRREMDDDTALAIICRTDPTDDPMHDESVWKKSMPVLGLTFPIENVRNAVKSASHSMAATMDVKRLYFGVPVGIAEYWIDLDAWESVQGTVNPDDMKGRSCWLALDLSQKNDLTALGIGWRGEDGKLYATVRYWKPAEKLSDAAKADGGVHYVEWSQPTDDGRPPILNVTPGRTIEYQFVAQEVRRWCSEHNVELMVFDPSFARDFRDACDEIGFDTWIWTPDEPYGSGLKMVIHGQGAQGMNSDKMLWMPRSLGQLEDMILSDGIVIDESPLTKWCAGNAAVKPDSHGNRYFVKKRQRGRIDGLTVMAMLAGASMADSEASSVYATAERAGGFLTL